MTGAPNLVPARVTAPDARSAPAARTAEGGRKPGEGPREGFEAVLTQAGAPAERRSPLGRAIPPIGADDGARPISLSREHDEREEAAAVAGAVGAGTTVDPAHVAGGARSAALGTQVAERIGAFLVAQRTEPAGQAGRVPGRAGAGIDPTARGEAEPASSAPPGKGVAFGELAVSRREAHLRPAARLVLPSPAGEGAPSEAAPQEARGEAQAAGRRGSFFGAQPGSRGVAAREGRGFGVATDGRAGSVPGSVPGPATAATATRGPRPGAEDVRPAGAEPPGATTRAAPTEAPPIAFAPAGVDRGLSFAAQLQAFSAARTGASQAPGPLAPGQSKALQIQLQPAELGTLEVRMTLTEAGLELRIEAGRRETFALLKADRELLAGVLRAAGHTLDSVTIVLAERSGAPPHASQQDGAAGWAQGGRPDAHAGSAHQGGGRPGAFPADGWDESGSERVRDGEERPARDLRRGGDVYL